MTSSRDREMHGTIVPVSPNLKLSISPCRNQAEGETLYGMKNPLILKV